MPGMKRDCGGAAGVLGAFYVAVKNGFSDTLHCILCLAENSVGPLATRPDDVHTMYRWDRDLTTLFTESCNVAVRRWRSTTLTLRAAWSWLMEWHTLPRTSAATSSLTWPL